MMPKDVSGVDLVFGGNMRDLLPAMSQIPDDFRHGRGDAARWVRFQRDWFFVGLKSMTATPKAGIDAKKAMAHLSAIQRSFEPKSEHKEAAVAWLASLWFEDVKYKRADEEQEASK